MRRHKAWLASYSHQPVGQPGIFPGSYISILVSRTDFVTVDDFRKLPWLLAKFHGAEVLKILHDADREHALTKLEEAQVRAAGVKGECKAEVREQEERARGVKLAEREQAKR